MVTASKDTNTKNTLKCKTCCGSNHYFSLISNFPFPPEHREGLPCRKMGPFALFMKWKQKRHTSLLHASRSPLRPFLTDHEDYMFRVVELQDSRTSINLYTQETTRRRSIPYLPPTNPQHPTWVVLTIRCTELLKNYYYKFPYCC